MPSESSPQDVVVHRLSASARKASSRVRFPWRTRKRAPRPALTAEQKKALQDARDDKKQNLRDALAEARDLVWDAAVKMEKSFGSHNTNYYFRLILQTALRIKKAPRKITLWNAFVSKELKKLNEEPSAEGPQRVNSVAIKDLSARWKEMSPEEQQAAAGDELEKLIERQQNKVKGTHNVALHACNDTHATLASVSSQLEELHGRTNNEFLLLAVRTRIDDLNPPYVFYSGERIADCVKTLTKHSVQDVAVKMEAYCIGGLEGMTRSSREETIALKHQVAELIYTSLQKACTRFHVPKMFYVNFADHMTVKYGIIIGNWPLNKFAAPGALSRVELLVLLQAWQNGVTYFREMDREEWAEWVVAYRAGRASGFETGSSPAILASAPDPAPPSTPATPTSPPATAISPPDPTPPSAPATSASDPTPELSSTSTPSTTPASPTPSSPSDTSPSSSSAISPSNQPPPHSAAAAAVAVPGTYLPPPPPPPPLAMNFINSVINPDGTGFIIPKRQRQERADKGKKRKDKPAGSGRPSKRARLQNTDPAASSGS